MDRLRTPRQIGGPRRLAVFGLLIALLVSLLPAASQNPVFAYSLAKVQPELRMMASQQSEQMVAVIVEKQSTDSANLTELIQALGGRVVYDLYMMNSLAVDIPAGALARLAASRDVGKITLDGMITGSAVEMEPVSKKKLPAGDPLNTYLATLNIPPNYKLTGAGVTVAILDSGVALNPDFGNRILARVGFNHDTPDKKNDKYGHGTFVAGIVAGDGGKSNGLYAGVAPGVNLVSVKIGGDDGHGYESDVVAAIQWLLVNKDVYNIRVANMSINSGSDMTYHQSFVNMMVEMMWFSDIVVVASAGTVVEGNNRTIRSAPANDPFVITVGATRENADVDQPNDPDRSNDVVAAYSASGTTVDNHVKPELVAPGTNIISVLADTSKWKQNYPARLVAKKQYFRASGTSMSAPMVSGAAALMLEANSSLTSGEVKCMLIESASDLDGVAYLDVQAAVALAQSGDECVDPNADTPPSILLGPVLDVVLSGDINWNSINWNSINWNSINWNSINWNSINWNSINWNSINWNSIDWDSIDWEDVDTWTEINWNSINWNSINWNSINWNSINWNSINWNSINWNSINWNSVSWED